MPDRFLHAVLAALKCDLGEQCSVSIKSEAAGRAGARVDGYGATSQEQTAASMMAAIIVEKPIEISGFNDEKASLIAAMRAASRYPFTGSEACRKGCTWGSKLCDKQTPEYGNPCYRALIDQWIARHASCDLAYRDKLPQGLAPDDWLELCRHFTDLVELYKRQARRSAHSQ